MQKPNASKLKLLQEMIRTNNDIVHFIPITAMDHIINSVRNTVLDWALKLEQEGILGNDLEFTGIEKEKANMTTHITIESFQGVFGDVSNSEVTQNLDMSIVKNDFEKLANFLQKNGVEDDDINLLNKAIQTDGVITKETGMGEKVSSWIGRMVAKSASGGWNISIATASNLLATAISQYYGL